MRLRYPGGLLLTAVLLLTSAACSSPGHSSAPTTSGTTSSKPSVPDGSSAVAVVQGELKEGTMIHSLPGGIVKQLPTALGNWFASNDDPLASANGQPPNTQGYLAGDQSASKTVVLFGDSNASMWVPSLDSLGKQRGFKVIAYIRFGCPFSDTPGYLPNSRTVDPMCSQWRNAIIAEVNATNPEPSAVVLAQFQQVSDLYPGRGSSSARVVQGVEPTLKALKVGTSPKIILVGVPLPSMSVPVCLSAHSSNIQLCASARPSTTSPRSPALGAREGNWYLADQNAALRGGGQAAWLTEALCGARSCPPVAAGLIPQALLEHVSIPWAQHVAAAFGELLACSATEQHSRGIDESWLTSTFQLPQNCPAEMR